MDWLSRLLSFGRVGRREPERSGGFMLASTQRAHLDLKATAFEAGCVQLITGQWRCVSTVTGWPLHARDAGEALAFLSQIATALNTAPTDFVLLARSYPGGLEDYATDRRVRSHAGGPLAKVMRDQAQHAQRQMLAGRYRKNGHFLITSGKTQREASDRMGDIRSTLKEAGVETALCAEGLAGHITNSWRPDFVEHFSLDFNGPDGETLAVLAYSPKHARAHYPKYAPEQRVLPQSKREALIHEHDASPAAPLPAPRPRRLVGPTT